MFHACELLVALEHRRLSLASACMACGCTVRDSGEPLATSEHAATMPGAHKGYRRLAHTKVTGAESANEKTLPSNLRYETNVA